MNYADPDRRKGFKLGGSTYIDQLTYGYQNTNASNKLSAIVNAVNDTTAKLGDFQYNPATKQTTDYTYDGNYKLCLLLEALHMAYYLRFLFKSICG
jgi:hypothetical protein